MNSNFTYSSNKGSEWRKWDLHFHTPSSYDYRGKSVTNENIIKTLKENKITAVAITDHHTIDVDRITELKLLAGNDITIFPGIELRSELGGSDSVHYIGIFPDDAKTNYIWEKLKGLLPITTDDISRKGNDNVYCDLKDTCRLIHELGGIVTIHAGNKSNSIEEISNALSYKMTIKKDIVDIVDAYEVGKVDDIKEYIERVFYHIKKRLPLIIGSDNHNINDYKLKTNCWIKADPTFEGLKQIIFEPEKRVKVQDTIPEEKTSYLVIEKVRFIDNNNGDFPDSWIYLNPNLNVIIGGKSSGKSLLIHHIAKTIESSIFKNDEFESREWYSNFNFDFEVEWKDGYVSKLSEEKEERKVTFIPQMYINTLIEKDGKSSLDKLVMEILLQDETIQALDNNNRSENEKEINEINNNIASILQCKNSIISLEEKVKDKGEKKVVEHEIEEINEQIGVLKNKSDFSDKELKEYNDLKESLDDLKNNIEKVEGVKKCKSNFADKLQNISELVTDFLKQEIIEVERELDEYPSEIDFFEKISQSLKEKIRTIVESNSEKILTQVEQDKLKVSELIEQKEMKETQLKPFSDKIKNQNEFSNLNNKLKVQKEILTEVKEFKKQIEIKNDEIKEAEDKLFSNYERLLNNTKKIQEEIKKKQSKLGTIDLNASLIFKKKNFYENFSTKVNKKSKLSNSFDCFDDENQFRFDEMTHLKNVKKIYNHLMNNKIKLNQYIDLKDVLQKLFANYFTIEFDLIKNEDNLSHMSPGKRGVVVFELFLHLSNSKCPILIDQPEDNLDNRTIFYELSKFISERKIDRQIIMVTHNPNLVVSTDSELVIVANQEGQQKGCENRQYRFEYVEGSLECSFENKNETGILFQKGIKEHVCEILEGGKEAFQKREEKYGFKNEIYKTYQPTSNL